MNSSMLHPVGTPTRFRVRSRNNSSVDARYTTASEAETSPMVKYRLSPLYRKMTRQLPFRFSMEAIGDNLGIVPRSLGKGANEHEVS